MQRMQIRNDRENKEEKDGIQTTETDGEEETAGLSLTA